MNQSAPLAFGQKLLSTFSMATHRLIALLSTTSEQPTLSREELQAQNKVVTVGNSGSAGTCFIARVFDRFVFDGLPSSVCSCWQSLE